MLNKLRQNKNFEYAVKMLDKKTLRLHVSALQSFLFNELLDSRIDAGMLSTVNNGDVAYLHRNGAAFIVEDEETDKKRCETFEISTSGPVVGTKLLLAEGATGIAEREILEKYELNLEDFNIGESLSQPGARRAFRVQLENLNIRKEENNLVVDFSLPSGSYATIFLKELTKPDC